MNGPFDGPYCGFVPTANTSLPNIDMGTMQMLMGVNTGAAIVKRQQQEEMDYLAELAADNAHYAQSEYENGLYQGRQEGYQAAQAEIQLLKAKLELAQGLSRHWETRYDKMQENLIRSLKVIDSNKLLRPKLYRYISSNDSGTIVKFSET